MEDKRQYEQMADLANRDKPVSMQALRKLSNLSREQAKALRAAWPGLEVERRRAIIRGMVTLAEDNIELNFDAVYKTALDDTDGEVRVAAIEGLWENYDPDTGGKLLQLLMADPEPAVRAAAASSLARFALEAELCKLRGDLPGRIEAGLLQAISTPGEPPSVRRRVVEAIGYLSHPRVPGIIEAAYHEADLEMQAGAIRAMGYHCDPRWLDLLLEELNSPEPELRFEAARSIGHLEDERAVGPLQKLLEDRDREVRLAAVAALGEIGGAEAKAALKRVLEGEDEEMAEAAEEALQELEFGEDPLRLGPLI